MISDSHLLLLVLWRCRYAGKQLSWFIERMALQCAVSLVLFEYSHCCTAGRWGR